MQNSGAILAGIAGITILTAGIGYAVSASHSPAPYEEGLNSTSPTGSTGMTEAEMNARIADERADAQAAAQAKIDCEHERQEASNTGAVVGGVTGAIIGSQVAGSGAKSEGGAIGAVAGVMTGRQIAKKDHRC